MTVVLLELQSEHKEQYLGLKSTKENWNSVFFFWPKTLLSLDYLNLLRCSHTVVNKHSSDKIISSAKASGH